MVMSVIKVASISASPLEILFTLDGLGGFLLAFVILSVPEVRFFCSLMQFLVKFEELKFYHVPAFLQLFLYNNERVSFGLFFLILGRGLFIFGCFFFFNNNLCGLCNVLFHRLKRLLWLLSWQLEFIWLEVYGRSSWLLDDGLLCRRVFYKEEICFFVLCYSWLELLDTGEVLAGGLTGFLGLIV